MRIVTCAEMRDIEDKTYTEYGFSESLIIENVGIRGADFIINNILREELFNELLFVIGKGNNGADGLAIARNLHRYGYNVTAFILAPDKDLSLELQKQLKMAKSYGVTIKELKDINLFEEYLKDENKNALIVDAIFGTGVRLPLPESILKLFSIINTYSKLTLSIDIPSGVLGDSGEIDKEAIKADITLTIGVPKIGHYINVAPYYTGSVFVLDGGFPEELLVEGERFLLQEKDVGLLLRNRNLLGFKNSFGHLLIIGGSEGLTGALSMATISALRIGTGLVTAMTWEDCYMEFMAVAPKEAMKKIVRTDDFKKYDAILIGPGLGVEDRARELVLEVLSLYEGTIILDADAINVLKYKTDLELLQSKSGNIIMTPHLGEFSRFFEISKSEIIRNPVEFLDRFVNESDMNILLKGTPTFLRFNDNVLFVHHRPNDAMAKGGSGDILAGIIGGLIAQNNALEEDKDSIDRIVSLGTLIHSSLGLFAREKYSSRSTLPSDLIDLIPNVILNIEKSE